MIIVDLYRIGCVLELATALGLPEDCGDCCGMAGSEACDQSDCRRAVEHCGSAVVGDEG